MSKTLPRISIITPSFNQGRYLRQNILSVLHQGYPDTEHIIVDAASTDETARVVREFPHIKWISEPDRGQADALNKGFALATGDIIGWLNADDWYESGIFRQVAAAFCDPAAQWAVGDITMHYEAENLMVAGHSPQVTYPALLRDPDIVRQPPAFFRRQFLRDAGGWDVNYHMVMDYDLWLRLSRRSSPAHVRRNWAYFRIHAAQKTTYANARRQHNEIVTLLRREKAPVTCRLRLIARTVNLGLRQSVKQQLVRLGILDPRLLQRPIRLT